MKRLVSFFLKVSIVIAIFYIYLYFDDKRQHKVMLECEQLIPTIEASKQGHLYPKREDLASSVNLQTLNACSYSPRNSGYRFAVAGTTFNFSLYIYVSEQQRWIHE